MTGALIFSTLFSFAQTEKGNFLLIGTTSLNADIGKVKTKTGGTTNDNYKYWDINFNPYIGYTVIDNLPIGIYLGVDFYKNTYHDGSDHYDRGASMTVGPFARYYFANLNGFMPMVEAAIGYGFNNTKSDYGTGAHTDKNTMWECWVAPGFTYFFNDRVGLDGMIGYYHQTINYKDQAGKRAQSDSDVSDRDNDIFVYIGVVVKLSK